VTYFVRDIILGPTVLAKTVGPKIVFPICISVGDFLRNVNSSMSYVYIQALLVVLLNSLTKCALVTRNA